MDRRSKSRHKEESWNRVCSHLNTFCVMTIQGHQDLQLEFSPCGSARFEPLPADYPVGRPARFAYVGADRVFRVVQASTGEKGPFTTLGEGRLESDARLSIGLVDDSGQRIAEVHLDDWAAESSTALVSDGRMGCAGQRDRISAVIGTHGKQNAVMIWIARGRHFGRPRLGTPSAHRGNLSQPDRSRDCSPAIVEV